MIRTVVVAGTLLLGITAVVAQQNAAVDAQNAMKGAGRSMGSIAPILKGEKPYDQATVDTAVATLADVAKKLPTMFPDSIKDTKIEGDYMSSPKVWEDKAGFKAKIDSFTAVVTGLNGKIKDLDALKAQWPAVGKECGGCHETYRVKKS